MGARPGTFATAPVAYERAAGDWRQWRLASARSDQDPDEADGRGAVVVSGTEPLGSWKEWPGRWGSSRAGWVPGEMGSPRGPAFQPPGRWSGWAGPHLGTGRAAVHARPLRRGRRVRRRETAIALAARWSWP